ncbi:MAG: putative bifunctional diguanylate cyclase/phosphodiesterase [Janthinobacterium lividum]
MFFKPVMEERVVARHALTIDLRKALLLRQFEVHYQPQIDLRSRSLIGFEALLRWKHPQLGWVPPAVFIPIAEETGLIGMIGDWVLRTACLQAAQLPSHITMAVNASPLQFRAENFLTSVETALRLADIPGSRLELEVTEGVLLQGEQLVLSKFNRLHELGTKLAMDDFGTGYSSFGQLARFPFDTIKIDRSLVGLDSKKRAIVCAIATLARGLDMVPLVEGIETSEDLDAAVLDGCVWAQGYLFGKARSAGHLGEVMSRFIQTDTEIMDEGELTL